MRRFRGGWVGRFQLLAAGGYAAAFPAGEAAHPLHQFFEAVFVLQEPTYSSIFPMGQGLAMAAGWLLTGTPWAGVLLSVGRPVRAYLLDAPRVDHVWLGGSGRTAGGNAVWRFELLGEHILGRRGLRAARDAWSLARCRGCARGDGRATASRLAQDWGCNCSRVLSNS